MSIGLDFVKKVDEDWEKFVKPIRLFEDDEIDTLKDNTTKMIIVKINKEK